MQNQEMSETSKYAPGQWVRMYKVSWDNSGRKTKQNWYEGKISSVLSRGLMVIPFDPEPMGRSNDSLAASFVPFTHITNDVEIEIVKNRN